ncbi:hypothetical protein [Bartonella sp. OD88NMGDW]
MFYKQQKKRASSLGKQRHKTQNMPAMDWKDVPAFYSPQYA